MATMDTDWIQLLDAATGTGTELQCGGASNVIVELEIPTGCNAGIVVLEHSSSSGYTGGWAPLGTKSVAASDFGGASSGPGKAIIAYNGPLGFIRPRITTTFSGGAGPEVTVRAKRLFVQ